MRYPLVLAVFLYTAAVFVPSCTSGGQLEEKVFVVNIRPGEERLRQYLEYHKAVWPEVEKGFLHAGYRQISLFRSGHTIVMIIKVPQGADLGAMGKKAEAFDKRCAEWNKLMAGYQEGVAGTAPGKTWTEAEKFYLFAQ